ncbi:hypothetical protein [Ilumatobacter coccineus]|uniref:DUF3499 domain-containing protein n=1 Tax=Ilumatobacter coccineus (strain NBRC 103263 / KCTC 29153 / YM16-304) TaxID=1313172 RepID=A0A6C7E975_ILUCY|nr:hypothetical protein [Ilumatobacter coccineus]BAN02562.1 hypothetical protein YM304_22480 [Ilumatobacter coccineus YM16-304]
MGRLCERPGCSENASVAYGMRAEDLVFWLDVIRPSENITGGVLCQRHADSMVVPRNWTLDDLRDPDLHLFRPPPIKRAPSSRTRRSGHRDDSIEQLQLGVVPDQTTDVAPADVVTADAAADTVTVETPTVVADAMPADETAATPDAVDADPESPWVPSFDSGDDLDGLLSARSPLLARAFRGDGRRN